ncbi:MAG: hypothetical protein P8P49_11795, partial [Opitutales bacterium]|nr:hypothetical protein [Opitutales bacterium]
YANSLFLQDLREEFYEDELIVGQPVRHDSREGALEDFNYLTYLDLNEDLGDWFQTEASAKQHFYERGFWSERRYFYYPYESNTGSVENLVNDNLVGQKVSTSGIIADLSNLEFQIDYYFIDSVNAAVHYSSNDSSVMPEHWALEKYFFKRLGNESGSFVLINNAGEKLIADVSFQTSSSGTTNLRFIDNEGNDIWSQGSGSWNVSSLDEAEIPTQISYDSVSEDFAPHDISKGLDYSSPSLESNDTFWPGYHEQVTFNNYDGWKEFSANVTFPIQNGSDYEYGNGGFDYFKIGKNSAILTLRFNDPNNWNSDEKRFIYHLQFTDENRGVYVKYSDYITELDVTTGLFKFNNLSATAKFAWESYDNFKSGTLDPRKWELGYFSGGQEPIFTEPDNMYQSESNLELKGNAFTGSDPIKVPNGSFWEEVGAATGSQGQSNSALFAKDESIIGIQARIQLPGNNSQQSGIYIAAPPSRVSLELVWRDQKEIPNKWGGFDSTSTYFDYYDDQDTSPSGGLKQASTGTWYTVSAIRDNGRVSYFIDGEILSTFDAGNDNPKDWMIGAFNDNGEAFSAFVDDVRVLRRDREQVLIEEIYVSGGDLNYPHYSFSDDNGSTIDMEDFNFKPDTIYRFIAKDLSTNHPFTMGISIRGSEIYKEILRPASSVEYSNLPDLEFETLVMAPTDDDYGNNNILSSEGDYFDFSYTSELLEVLLQNDVKFHYVCDIHTSMNGQLFLSDIDTAKKVYVSGGDISYPYYNFSNEDGPIDLSTYEFEAGEDYRFIAFEGFTSHAFAIGSAPSASSSYVSGGPLEAVADELTLSIPSDFDSSTETLVFYCVAHPTTMYGKLR